MGTLQSPLYYPQIKPIGKSDLLCNLKYQYNTLTDIKEKQNKSYLKHMFQHLSA